MRTDKSLSPLIALQFRLGWQVPSELQLPSRLSAPARLTILAVWLAAMPSLSVAKKPAAKDYNFERRSRASKLGHVRRMKREMEEKVEELTPQVKWQEEAFNNNPCDLSYAAMIDFQYKLTRAKASVELYENIVKARERARDEHRAAGH